MAKRGKKYLIALKQIEKPEYDLKEAIELIKNISFAKFDETVELAVKLGVDPRKTDQQVQGTVLLPNGHGLNKRVAVIASADKVNEAREAGADEVGGVDFCEKIKKGYLEFDALIATPDMMKEVGKLGRILGPRKLMPNAKTGTVTFNVGKIVKDLKFGLISYKTDKTANVHTIIGKLSMEPEKLYQNAVAVLESIIRAKPPAAKGRYIKSVHVASTMSPGVKITQTSIDQIARK